MPSLEILLLSKWINGYRATAFKDCSNGSSTNGLLLHSLSYCSLHHIISTKEDGLHLLHSYRGQQFAAHIANLIAA